MGFKYRKRTFLAPASTGTTSYVLGEVENSLNGENKWGSNMLTIADCHKSIRLEFFLGTKQRRRESLRKLNFLISQLVKFGNALTTESQLIDELEKSEKSSKKRTKKKTVDK